MLGGEGRLMALISGIVLLTARRGRLAATAH
jgi:hypothetical protein